MRYLAEKGWSEAAEYVEKCRAKYREQHHKTYIPHPRPVGFRSRNPTITPRNPNPTPRRKGAEVLNCEIPAADLTARYTELITKKGVGWDGLAEGFKSLRCTTATCLPKQQAQRLRARYGITLKALIAKHHQLKADGYFDGVEEHVKTNKGVQGVHPGFANAKEAFRKDGMDANWSKVPQKKKFDAVAYVVNTLDRSCNSPTIEGRYC